MLKTEPIKRYIVYLYLRGFTFLDKKTLECLALQEILSHTHKQAETKKTVGFVHAKVTESEDTVIEVIIHIKSLIRH